MSNVRVLILILSAGFAAGSSFPAAASGDDTTQHTRPEREVLTVAEDVGFDYMGNLRSAEKGQANAIVALINFSPRADAAASLAHGWVLLELQKMVGKKKFASALAHATAEGRKTALGDMRVARTYK